MTVTTTNRLGLSKPDNNELVSIALVNANMDKIDTDFRPACMIRATVNQSFTTAVAATLAFDAIAFDSYAARPEGPMADLTSDRIVIRKTGLYVVGSNNSWATNAGGYRRIRMMKNGAQITVNRKQGHNVNGEQNPMETHILELFTSGDFLTSEALQTSGGALNATPEGNGSVYLYALYAGSIV